MPVFATLQRIRLEPDARRPFVQHLVGEIWPRLVKHGGRPLALFEQVLGGPRELVCITEFDEWPPWPLPEALALERLAGVTQVEHEGLVDHGDQHAGPIPDDNGMYFVRWWEATPPNTGKLLTAIVEGTAKRVGALGIPKWGPWHSVYASRPRVVAMARYEDLRQWGEVILPGVAGLSERDALSQCTGCCLYRVVARPGRSTAIA